MLKLGIIDYLNTLPVYYGLLNRYFSLPCETIKGTPTELNQLLSTRSIDISVISSFEYAKHPERYLLFPNLSVSADDSVKSIYLFSNQHLSDLSGAVQLPQTSYTSIHLLQYLLRNHDVNFFTEETKLPQPHTAKLLIGDDAIREYYRYKYDFVYDLATLWKEETQLPFVFAVWAVHRESYEQHKSIVHEIHQTLALSKSQFRHQTHVMAQQFNQEIFPNLQLCADYLKNLRYEFSTPYQQGFQLFQEKCVTLGFLDTVSSLEFIEGSF